MSLIAIVIYTLEAHIGTQKKMGGIIIKIIIVTNRTANNITEDFINEIM